MRVISIAMRVQEYSRILRADPLPGDGIMIGKRPCFFNAWWWWWWCHCVAGAMFCCARTVKTRVRGGTDGGHRCERVRNDNEREGGKEVGKWEPLSGCSCLPFDKQQTPKRNEKIKNLKFTVNWNV